MYVISTNYLADALLLAAEVFIMAPLGTPVHNWPFESR